MTLIQIGGTAPAWSAAGLRASRPEATRVRAATILDMDRVEPLINGFARRGRMLPKTREQLHRTFREFVVAEDHGGRVLGCVALRVYTATVGEVSALAVAEAAQGTGVGRRLMERLTADAVALGLDTLFALTLEAGFFHRLGYRTVDRSLFPLKIAADCAACPRRGTCSEITVTRRIVENEPSYEEPC